MDTEMSREDVLDLVNKCVPYAQQTVWVMSSDMSDAEKKDNPEHETTGGYLKAYETVQEAISSAWANLSQDERKKREEMLRTLPNFDASKLLACTGIDLSFTNKQEITIDGLGDDCRVLINGEVWTKETTND